MYRITYRYYYSTTTFTQIELKNINYQQNIISSHIIKVDKDVQKFTVKANSRVAYPVWEAALAFINMLFFNPVLFVSLSVGTFVTLHCTYTSDHVPRGLGSCKGRWEGGGVEDGKGGGGWRYYFYKLHSRSVMKNVEKKCFFLEEGYFNSGQFIFSVLMYPPKNLEGG